MKDRRLYFDNAATSFPKPQQVYQEMDRYARQVGASAGRGAYSEAIQSGQIIDQTRRRIAQLLNCPEPNQIIMTFNCTDGLSLAIKGLLTQRGGHVITSKMDHNSVLRPLNALKEQLGIEVTFVPADSKGLVDPDNIKKAIRPDTKLIALVHGSNVCGSVQDIATVGQMASEHGIPYLVDAAQTVGHLPIDVQSFPVDMMAFPAHKGLLGPLGTGALYIRQGFEEKIRPLREGGTGSKSEEAIQPAFLPDRFEAGSHNALGIAGLNQGVGYVLEKGMDSIRAHEEKLCEAFLAGTRGIQRLTVYGPDDISKRVGVFSVRMDGYSPMELSAILEQRFGLLTRPGLHCAPLAHASIGTLQDGGTTRFSMGPFLTGEDVRYAAESLAEISRAPAIS